MTVAAGDTESVDAEYDVVANVAPLQVGSLPMMQAIPHQNMDDAHGVVALLVDKNSVLTIDNMFFAVVVVKDIVAAALVHIRKVVDPVSLMMQWNQ